MGSNYISFQDVAIGFLWFIILLVISSSKANKIEDTQIKKYYIRNVLFKFLFAILFALIYLLYYGGGDTVHYWDGAITLNKLFFKSPTDYLVHLLSEPTAALHRAHFDVDTGYPPGWIYGESESWFICKINSLMAFYCL